MLKFFNFHLMPYADLDLREIDKAGSAWNTLSNRLYDPVKGADLYHRYLDEMELADRVGFDGVVVNEHHQTAYGLMPIPGVLAGALARSVKRAKVAVLGRALPLLANPLNVAEEYAILDNLTRGRLIAGFVRGIGAEYHASGANPGESHERFHEAHDMIIRAWTEPGPFAYEGKHYHFRYVNPWPRPYQTPHPPVWIPSMGSRETVVWASAPGRKYPFMVTFSPETAVVRYHAMYREAAKAHGYTADGSQLGWAVPIYVADTDERAREEARAGIETLFNNFLRMPWEMLLPPGYTSNASMKVTLKLRTSLGAWPRKQSIEELIASGTIVVGSPQTVRERIERVRDQTGFEILITLLQFGVLSDELAWRNMEMFAGEVMPKLR